jgi:mannose-6-phosphate isomerase-like protein (cupin superfamily)
MSRTAADDGVRFRIFRRSEGRLCDLMTYEGAEVTTAQAVEQPGDQADGGSLDQGVDLKVLFDKPGLSLVHAWFKSEYPLPRHTHNVDCIYYIVAGSLRMGEEVLRAGDGFFVGADVPYTYTPGPDGLEILEFRASNAFDIKVMGDQAKLRAKSQDKIMSRQEAWSAERPPSEAQSRAEAYGSAD